MMIRKNKTLIVITTAGRYRRWRSEKKITRHALRRRPRVIVSARSFLFARVKKKKKIIILYYYLTSVCKKKKKKSHNRVYCSRSIVRAKSAIDTGRELKVQLLRGSSADSRAKKKIAPDKVRRAFCRQ